MKIILLAGVLLAAALLRAEEPKPLNADEKDWWDVGGRQFGLFSKRD